MTDIIFNWIRGDDEAETLVFTEENGEPLDFPGSRFDCDIVPLGSASEKICLSGWQRYYPITRGCSSITSRRYRSTGDKNQMGAKSDG
ncbi:hypothetical protein [uncultured Haemophilus sp.]|uniref:hypothetical protein n=1 Tax=uncultured Haemophilus sp. TaxID=237779 RepID=UPI002616AFAA|nr:hypothetical protein [uncultured Haemophilus sp.]